MKEEEVILHSGYKFIDNKEQHLHTYDMVPLLGTSTVLSILTPPLTWWASGLAVKEFGISDPKVITKIKNKTATVEEVKECMVSVGLKHQEIKNMPLEGYYNLLDKAYRAHSVKLKDSAKKGTDLHAELEKFVKHVISSQLNSELTVQAIVQGCTGMFDSKIQPFIEWSSQNVKKFLFSELHTYSQEYWIGGITDAGVELNSGEYAIIDFKSSKDAYQTQFWQIAGYNIQLEESGGYTADGEKIFILDKPVTQYIVVPFGKEPVVPVFSKYELNKCKKAFLGCLTVYKLTDQYVG